MSARIFNRGYLIIILTFAICLDAFTDTKTSDIALLLLALTVFAIGWRYVGEEPHQ